MVLKMPSKFSMWPDQEKVGGFIRRLRKEVGTASRVCDPSAENSAVTKHDGRDHIITCLLSCIWFGRVILRRWYFHAITEQCSLIQRFTRRTLHVPQWRSSSGCHSGDSFLLTFTNSILCDTLKASIQSYETAHSLWCISRKRDRVDIQLGYPVKHRPPSRNISITRVRYRKDQPEIKV